MPDHQFNQNQVGFNNDRRDLSRTQFERNNQKSLLIRLAMKCGAKNEEQARSALLGFVVVVFAATLYIFFFSGKHTSSYPPIPASEKDDFFHVYKK